MTYTIHHGDCLDVLRAMDGDSVDAVVTDPPYGLSFMGKRWDYDVPAAEIWTECLRVLRPGGHLLAFAGTRTQHRMAVRIEDAGFEIRDMIAWVYGSGFPKSHDVSKGIDRAAGVDHLRAFKCKNPADRPYTHSAGETSTGWQSPVRPDKTHAYSDAAREWSGWGTALKPALEPITVARKPLIGTVAENVLAHGTGGLNIDGCRVEGEVENRGGWANAGYVRPRTAGTFSEGSPVSTGIREASGRWPANFIHDGSDEVTGLFPSARSAGNYPSDATGRDGVTSFAGKQGQLYADTGSAARFFYCAKASKADRDEGLDHLPERTKRILGDGIPSAVNSDPRGMSGGGDRTARNIHPTVKPTDLMRYLCRLVTPPGGLVLDPFAGSGSTGKAAVMEGFRFVGIEREAEYVEIARARIAAVAPTLFAAE